MTAPFLAKIRGEVLSLKIVEFHLLGAISGRQLEGEEGVGHLFDPLFRSVVIGVGDFQLPKLGPMHATPCSSLLRTEHRMQHFVEDHESNHERRDTLGVEGGMDADQAVLFAP